MGFLRRLTTGLRGTEPARARGVPGERAYAIGDIHGRQDLLDELLALIEADIAAHPGWTPRIIFLGDYIDRGPASAGVIERLATYSLPNTRCDFLIGNHEEALQRVLNGDPGVLYSWLRFGGDACAESYGIDVAALWEAGAGQAAALLGEHLPRHHLRFLNELKEYVLFGDFLFIHAGIRPGIPLARQVPDDTRWIREPFLSHTASHGMVVVHGHTVVDEPEDHANRIAIDTGAYRSGVLSAVVIADDRRTFLSTGQRAT